MRIGQLAPAPGSKRSPKRIGRGHGSGHGKTATKGHKGQKARSGGNKGPYFEGGQTPLQRRIPKRGFKNTLFKKRYAIINLKEIDILELSEISPETLLQSGAIKKIYDGLKILGEGDIKRAVSVKAHACSSSAEAKIKAAGGSIEKIA
ncbi:MAG: 50S ribosomal protein L15 [Nitrospirae bacterium]|nr:50S ribosomal protein L15 [Nitrospirota bacterium]